MSLRTQSLHPYGEYLLKLSAFAALGACGAGINDGARLSDTPIPRPPIHVTVVPRPPTFIILDKCKNDKAYYESNKDVCLKAIGNDYQSLAQQGTLLTRSKALLPTKYIESLYNPAVSSDVTSAGAKMSQDPTTYTLPLSSETYKGWKKVVRRGNISSDVELKPAYSYGFVGLTQGSFQGPMVSGVNTRLKLSGVSRIDLPLISPWSANGNEVASCSEYAYERNFEYHGIDAEIAPKQDYREMFELVKTKKGNDEGFRSRDGNVSLTFLKMTERIDEFLRNPNNTNQLYEAPNHFYDMFVERNLAVVNPAVFGSMGFQPYKYSTLPAWHSNWQRHDMKWHFDAAQALSNVSDDELIELDRVQERFVELLKYRSNLTDQHFSSLDPYLKCYTNVVRLPYEEEQQATRPHLPDIGDPMDIYRDFNTLGKTNLSKVWDARRTMGPISHVAVGPIAGGGLIGAGTTQPMSYSKPQVETIQVPYSYDTDYGVTKLSLATWHTMLPYLSDKAFQGKCFVRDVDYPKVQQLTQQSLARLADADSKLDKLLAIGAKEGCFFAQGTSSTPSGVTKCDWSPRKFVDVIRSGFAQIEQQDYRSCRSKTKQIFYPNALGRRAIGFKSCGGDAAAKSQDYDNCVSREFRGTYIKSTTAFDNYLATYAAYMNQLNDAVRKAKGMVVKYDGLPYTAIGTRRSTFPSVGDSFFGGNASVLGEMLTYFDGSLSPAEKTNQLRMASSLDANVTLLSMPLNVAKISVSLESQGAKHFKAVRTGTIFNGKEIFTDGFPTDSDDAFSYVTSANQASLASPHAYFVVPVLGFVNITIDGYGVATAGIGAGMMGTVDATTRTITGDGATDPATIKMQAGVEPYASVDAFVIAALSVGIADVGVKGNLQLVRVGLPLTFHSDWDINYYRLVGSLDLDLQSLSGRVAAFVDLPWPAGDLEGTIFSWNGLHTTNNLFKQTVLIDSMAVQTALIGTDITETDPESDQ